MAHTRTTSSRKQTARRPAASSPAASERSLASAYSLTGSKLQCSFRLLVRVNKDGSCKVTKATSNHSCASSLRQKRVDEGSSRLNALFCLKHYNVMRSSMPSQIAPGRGAAGAQGKGDAINSTPDSSQAESHSQPRKRALIEDVEGSRLHLGQRFANEQALQEGVSASAKAVEVWLAYRRHGITATFACYAEKEASSDYDSGSNAAPAKRPRCRYGYDATKRDDGTGEITAARRTHNRKAHAPTRALTFQPYATDMSDDLAIERLGRSRSQPASVSEARRSLIRSISPELFVPAAQTPSSTLPVASNARDTRSLTLTTPVPPDRSARTTSFNTRLDQSSRTSTFSTGAVATQLQAFRVNSIANKNSPPALEAVLAASYANSSSAIANSRARSLLTRLGITTAEHVTHLRLLSPEIRDAMLGGDERELLAPLLAI